MTFSSFLFRSNIVDFYLGAPSAAFAPAVTFVGCSFDFPTIAVASGVPFSTIDNVVNETDGTWLPECAQATPVCLSATPSARFTEPGAVGGRKVVLFLASFTFFFAE